MLGGRFNRLVKSTVLVKKRIARPDVGSRKSGARKSSFSLTFNRQVIQLDKRRKYIIGRVKGCDLRIKNARVSRQHGKIRWNSVSQTFLYEDLQSSNGSLINEKSVNWGHLKDGDIINIIDYKIFFNEQPKVPNHRSNSRQQQSKRETAMLEEKFSEMLQYADDAHLKVRLHEYHRLIVESRKNLSLLAYHDQTTGLFNRRYFDLNLKREEELGERHKTPVSLIMIDIDRFKKFNDKYGHQKGDEVLEGVAGIIRASVRRTDITCRYGGEEMAVILPNSDCDKVLKIAQKICRRVAVLSQEQFGVRVTISLGVASSRPQRRYAPEQLIKIADQALYQAKENGRNRVMNA